MVRRWARPGPVGGILGDKGALDTGACPNPLGLAWLKSGLGSLRLQSDGFNVGHLASMGNACEVFHLSKGLFATSSSNGPSPVRSDGARILFGGQTRRITTTSSLCAARPK